ncbi:hypothetical protein L1049_009072 [Liquidambar formosana]|uniref:Disease resistance protein At4g27190-like leucine-rich repeats domain-containing protein n=1 Tax=Liquidambar formosana TaxID=63359 RepID=A0AAP0S7A8_LIQFO
MRVQSCNKLLIVFSSNLIQSLQNLEKLEVKNCDSLELVFDFAGINIEALTCLKNLKLLCLPKLTHLWKKTPPQIHGFQSLLSVEVDDCRSLKNIFTPSIAKVLVKLEALRVCACAITEIVGKDEEDGEENEEVTKVTVFPQLNRLHLENLPNLFSFGPKPYTFKWPALKELSLNNANMKVFVPAFLSTQKQRTINVKSHEKQVAFPSLEDLYLHFMDKLNEICCEIDHRGIRGFQNLKYLQVWNCGSLRHVFYPSMARGGVGNTMTVKEVGSRAKAEKLCDAITMAVVSQTPCLAKSSIPEVTVNGNGPSKLGEPSHTADKSLGRNRFDTLGSSDGEQDPADCGNGQEKSVPVKSINTAGHKISKKKLPTTSGLAISTGFINKHTVVPNTSEGENGKVTPLLDGLPVKTPTVFSIPLVMNGKSKGQPLEKPIKGQRTHTLLALPRPEHSSGQLPVEIDTDQPQPSVGIVQ